MTQKDVVGDSITRNMLSRIEHDRAAPSVKTLELIANALGLQAGYFLTNPEADDGSPDGIDGARDAYRNRAYLRALDLLNDMGHSRSSGKEEACLLRVKCCSGLAAKSYKDGHLTAAHAYAREALKNNAAGLYFDLESELRCCLILMYWAIRNRSADYPAYEKRYLTLNGYGIFGERFLLLRALRAHVNEGAAAAAPFLHGIRIEDLRDRWARAVCLYLEGTAQIDAGQYGESLQRLNASELDAESVGDPFLLLDIQAAAEKMQKRNQPLIRKGTISPYVQNITVYSRGRLYKSAP